MDVDAFDTDRVVSWVSKHNFQRVAVQFSDELLEGAPGIVACLQRKLRGRKIFVLGDSPYGGSSVDEVGAEHYGADCIVKVGQSDQQRVGSMPVLFLFGKAPLVKLQASALVSALREHLGSVDDGISLVVLCDVAFQNAVGSLAAALTAMLHDLGSGDASSVLIAEPDFEVSQGVGGLARWRDWRFGVVPSAAWWCALGPLVTAAMARPEPLRICGRRLRCAVESPGVHDIRLLPRRCGFIYVGCAELALERRLLLRYGQAHPVWRLELSDGTVTRLSSNGLLLQRYRFVELVKSAGVFGLLLCSTGASQGQVVADRLEALLRRAGRRVHRFLIGRPTTDKLGNFPDVECFVSLASPEHFPFNARDFHVPIASPYEVEVALGAREWSGDYITDLDELVDAPLPIGPPAAELFAVQTLGASARVRCFSSAGDSDGHQAGASAPPGANRPRPAPRPPALAGPGLHGVPSRYATEAPSGQR